MDGCPNLESLDLRQCFNVYLQGDLEKRCAEKIRDFRRPHDSTEGYEYDLMPRCAGLNMYLMKTLLDFLVLIMVLVMIMGMIVMKISMIMMTSLRKFILGICEDKAVTCEGGKMKLYGCNS